MCGGLNDRVLHRYWSTRARLVVQFGEVIEELQPSRGNASLGVAFESLKLQASYHSFSASRFHSKTELLTFCFCHRACHLLLWFATMKDSHAYRTTHSNKLSFCSLLLVLVSFHSHRKKSGENSERFWNEPAISWGI